MKKLILSVSIFIFLVSTAHACSGDCLSCHPKLINNIQHDMRHLPMKSCSKCHKSTNEKMAECGSDCFACHRIEKIEKFQIREHKIIRECRDCHLSIKQSLQPKIPVNETILKTFLIQ